MGSFDFGNYICELREKKGWSQSQLGEKLGVTNKAVSRWENGGAYPSTELMLPLAEALGVTIEDLYKAISASKVPKTRLRGFLEAMTRHSRLITWICFALMLLPYGLFLLFGTVEQKWTLVASTPVICVIAYGAFYPAFRWAYKNPFVSEKVTDIYTVIFLGLMLLGYISTVQYLFWDFPNGFTASSCLCAAIVLAVVRGLKRRYK
ncbi:MAG: helix-turn-helix transcriptional regulator [Clostridia bacterium]|nr:helix-turn-helix transcriptional regulator [Clostridia bacterium]